MQEVYTLVQAARLIGVTPRIFVAWLKDAGIFTRKGDKDAGEDARAQYVTRAQVVTLAAAHKRTLPDDASLAGLASQIQTLAAELDTMKRRLAILEQQKSITRERQTTPAPLQSQSGPLARLSADLADTLKRPSIEGATISKAEAARIVSERHSVLFATARQWPWPPSALVSPNAAIRWALDYVASIAPHKRPAGWRQRCQVTSCPCQQ